MGPVCCVSPFGGFEPLSPNRAFAPFVDPVSPSCSPAVRPAFAPSPRLAPSPHLAPEPEVEHFPAVWQPLDAESEQEKAPKKRSRRSKAPPPPPTDVEVTLMLRHLPLDYSPDGLLAELKDYVPDLDFFYLPTNFETKKNLGYAFVNFTDKVAAKSFAAFWEQSGVPESDDEPVQEARVQGYAANVERFRHSSSCRYCRPSLSPSSSSGASQSLWASEPALKMYRSPMATSFQGQFAAEFAPVNARTESNSPQPRREFKD